MTSVVSTPTSIIPFALCFHPLKNNPIFSHSKILGHIRNSLKNPSFLLNHPTNIRFITSLKPFQNPNRHQFQIRSLKTESASSSGEIHVIVGPMFAGKTTTLLRRIRTESSNGRSVAVIKSNKDSRYAFDSIVTHDGEKLPCWPLADLSNKSLVPRHMIRRSFGSVLEIIPLADSVTKLNARCELCGKCALFTLRKTEETQTELIAGAEVYMPVCRKHYVSGQVIKEATKTILESHKVQCNAVL